MAQSAEEREAVKEELLVDAMVSGRSIARCKPDGTLERIDPSNEPRGQEALRAELARMTGK